MSMTEDKQIADEPAYGKRVSAEELAQIMREQGIQAPAGKGGDVAAGFGRANVRTPNQQSARSQAAGGTAKPKGRWGLFLIGLVTLLVLPMAVMVGAVNYVTGGNAASAAVVPESGAVYLQQGTQAGVYTTQFGYKTSDCSVKGPDGVAIVTTVTGQSSASTFKVSKSGLHTVTCPGVSPSAMVLVGPALVESRIWVGAAGILVGGFIGLVGLGLTIAGLVRVVRRRPSA
ncbi:Uncharacterised protein [Actinomyces bovis]|uniref:Uncharacterized protein n=1 Tax=Actinomyces bovis TaxID=1658 RepID=A0ABY1VNN9_9ACTO|nr:hypothetical protein [Actinomyces bovis]SPT53665.1 Uncharacterised protein [Actinomyces bovis]VEG55760.1 Uncharacterised protein [Actinomyces israelii]